MCELCSVMSIFRRRPSFGRAESNHIIPCSPTTLISPLRRLTDSKMSILRIGLGLQVICYGLSLRGDWLELLGRENQGLIRRDLAEAILSVRSPFIPRVGWIVDCGAHLGLSEATVLWAV